MTTLDPECRLSPILTAAQIRAADEATIHAEPIASIDLMERAAIACTDWLMQHISENRQCHIFCGSGNNGGDGFAIARLLYERGRRVSVYWIHDNAQLSHDAQCNLEQLKVLPIPFFSISQANALPQLYANDCVIDALLGTGASRETSGLLAQTIEHINQSNAKTIIAIDLPSGLLADQHTPKSWPVVQATHTLTFECLKPALLWPENAEYVGDWHLLPIGLDQTYLAQLNSRMQLVTEDWAKTQYKSRGKFSHKGTYGHALLIAGAQGTVGAAILAARACLRTGAGLLTIHSPKCAYIPLQIAIPEAMVQMDSDEAVWRDDIAIEKYSAIGIGCGIAQAEATRSALRQLLKNLDATIPIVLDADALNILATEPDLLEYLPTNTILTPHPKEFARLIAHLGLDISTNELQYVAQQKLAERYGLIVVLKGAHTCTMLPDGRSFYNNTGNPGMAKGGSGDALTGVILGLLAQGYDPAIAAILGIYLHGLAGDVAAQKYGQIAMLPSDLIECLGQLRSENQ